MDKPNEQKCLGDDLVVGADAIARELGFSKRRVYHLADQGQLPIHRVKGLGLTARKSALRAYFEKLDRNATAQQNLFDHNGEHTKTD